MANQSKLKAWLRYDGTGRVVTAGPIFQANKPKVGNWRQMNIDLCCNPGGTTTTTTTGGTNIQPTAFVKSYWLSAFDSCNTSPAGSLLFYSASTEVTAGITVFQDAALTIPVTEGYVVMGNDPMANPFLVGAGGLLSERVCTTSTTTTTGGGVTVSATFSTAQCSGNFMISPITYPPGVTNFCDATTITSDALYMSPNPVWITVDGFTANYSISGNVGTRLSPCTSCG